MPVIAVINRKGGNGKSTMATHLAAWLARQGAAVMLGVIGMRIDARTRAAETLKEWADGLNIPFLGFLRETQIYVRSLDSGQTIFDQRSTAVQADLDQWEPILQWLQPDRSR